MKLCWKRLFLLVAWLSIYAGLFPGSATAADGQGSVRGVLYVSYPGDLSYDVMFGKDVEVLLLRGEKSLESELESLKEKRLADIRNQEAAILKAHRELKTPSKDKAKQQERREAFKREVGKYDKLRSDYERDFLAVVEKYIIQRTKTDAEGKFSFKQLFPGGYFLYARYEIPSTVNRYFWLHPVELKEKGEVEVHLNKSASISIY